MAEEEKESGIGAALVSFLVGAVFGVGIAMIVEAKRKDDEEAKYGESPLFI